MRPPKCHPTPLDKHNSIDLERLRDRRGAQRRVSRCRRDVTTRPARHSGGSSRGCARSRSPAGRWQAGWKVSEETGARVMPRAGRGPLSAVTAGCVVRGHAHPRPGDCPGITGCPACCPACCPERATRPDTAALAAAGAPGHKPHHDEDGHRDQPGNRNVSGVAKIPPAAMPASQMARITPRIIPMIPRSWSAGVADVRHARPEHLACEMTPSDRRPEPKRSGVSGVIRQVTHLGGDALRDRV